MYLIYCLATIGGLFCASLMVLGVMTIYFAIRGY